MDVSTLISRIIYLGMDESAPDTNLQTKVLGWLNSAYKEVYGLAAKAAWPILLNRATVTITSGSGTLAAAPYRILQVRDTTNKKVLQPTDILAVSQRDPSVSRTGAPTHYYIEGETALKTFPISSTSVEVLTIPNVDDLAVDGAESTIKIPPRFHELLIWASILEAATYERGFGNDALITTANTRKTQLLDNFINNMSFSQPHEPQRVQFQDF